MTQLLDAIAAEGGSVSLKVLSATTTLHPSTAFRILASLIEHGFVARDATGCYQLGRKLRELGYRVTASLDIREESREIMERLRDKVRESVNLTIREGNEVVYVERVTPNRMMRVEQVIGSRAPLHVTAVGKLLLGELGDQQIERYARETGLPGYTKKTIRSLDKLRYEIRRGRESGVALDNEEAEIGVGCIGVLIRDKRGAAVAGLSVSAPIERRREEWIPLVQEAAKKISEQLGYRDKLVLQPVSIDGSSGSVRG